MSEGDLDGRDSSAAPIGMLAGGGLLPVCLARGARRRGVRVVAIAVKGETSPELAREVDEIHWTGIARLGQWIKIFKRAGVSRAVMCGRVDKANMYGRPASLMPDWRTTKLWYSRLRSRRDHSLLAAVADELESEGIRVESSILYCPELLAPEGCLTRRRPTEREWEDIRFGWPIAKQVAALEIGQTVVVKDKAVITVEGMDGTDEALRRGGRIGRGGVVAVKVAKEGHDERFDIPCIGPDTVGVLKEAGVSCLAVEAGKTILLDRDEIVARARSARLSLVALGAPDALCDEGQTGTGAR